MASRSHSSPRVPPGTSFASPRARSRAPAARAHPPPFVSRREPLELDEDVRVGRIVAEGLLDHPLRSLRVLHLHFEHAREVEPRARAIAHGHRAVHLPAVERREILAPPELPVHPLERVERLVEERVFRKELLDRFAARPVPRITLERLPESREAARTIGELVNLQARESMQQLRLSARVGLERDPPLEYVGERARVVQPPIEPIERREERRRVSRLLGRLRVRLRGARVVPQLLLRHATEPRIEVRRHGRVEQVRCALGESVGVPPPPRLPEPLREPLGLLVQLRVVRLLDERAQDRVERPVRVGEARLRDLRQRPKRPRPLVRLRLRAEAQLEDVREVGPPLGPPEDGLEHRGRLETQVLVLLAEDAHGGGRVDVVLVDENLAVGVERLPRVLELPGEERADPLLQEAPRPLVRHRGNLLPEVLEQLGPHALERVEGVQALEHVRIRRPHAERFVQVRDGLAPVLEPGLVARSRVDEELELQPLIVLAAEIHPPPVQVDEPRGVVLLLVERDEVVDGERARALELERALVGLDGARQILQHVALRLADAPPGAGAVLVARQEFGLLREDAHQRFPVGEEGRQGVHLLERRDVGLVLLEEAVPRLERLARVVAPAVVHAREAREELALADPLGLRDPLLVRVRERVPALRRLGEPIELPARLPVVGIEHEGRAHGVEGLPRISPSLLLELAPSREGSRPAPRRPP